jgi:hypothetical protein
MAKAIIELTVFIASPGDVRPEREILDSVAAEINLSQGVSSGCRLRLIKWETDVIPGLGTDAQSVVNEQVGTNYDVFLGIMSNRFGQQTNKANSGTEEEFNNALQILRNVNESLKILFYFILLRLNCPKFYRIR